MKDTNGKHYLLTIGVDKYKSGKISNLNCAVNDVTTLRDLFIDRYQFSIENSFHLVNEKATANLVAQKLRDLQTIISNKDSLVVIFAGHGVLNQSIKNGYWVLHDAEYGNYESYLAVEAVKTILKAVNAKHIFLIIDSCYSGVMANRDIEPNIKKHYKSKSRLLITSGKEEIVDDEYKDSHSPFTYSIIKAIEESAENYLWAMELYLNAIKIMPNDVSQTPRICPLVELGDKGGQYVLIRNQDSMEKLLLKKESINLETEKNVIPEQRDFPKKNSKTEIQRISVGNRSVFVNNGSTYKK